MTDYLLLLLAAILLAVDFGLNQAYQRSGGTSLKAGFRFNALLGAFTAIVFFFMNGCRMQLTGYSMLLAAGLSALAMSYTLLGFRVLKAGGMAIYTVFLMTGGMVVPYLFGLIFLDESFSILHLIGLALIVGGILLSNSLDKGGSLRLFLLCAAIFLLNGSVSVLSKLHQIETALPTVSTTEFVLLSGIFKFLFAGAAYGIVSIRERRRSEECSEPSAPLPRRRLLLLVGLIVCSAVIGGVSYALQLAGAANLPATVLYPMITGGSIVFSTLVGILVFHEKPSRRLLIGIGLCFLGTLLFL